MMAAPGYITPAAGSAPVFRDPFARKRKRARPLQDQGLLPQLRKAANSLGIHLLDDKASCHQPLDEHRNEDYQYDDDQYSPHQQHFPVVDPSSSSTYTYADSIYRKDSSTDGSRPKHIPIVITPYASLQPAKNSPNGLEPVHSRRSSVVSVLSNPFTSLTLTSPITRHASTDSGLARARHVEIVIPDWAHPVQALRDSPTSPADSQLSRSASPTTIRSIRLGTMASGPGQTSPTRLGGGRSRAASVSASNLSEPTTAASLSSVASTSTNNINTPATAITPSSATVPTSITNISPSYALTDERGIGTSYSNRNGSSISLSQSRTLDGDISAGGAARTSGGDGADLASLMPTAGLGTPSQSTPGQSGLVCNVHRTTGREPRASVGATTTILGDKLYVFGGRRLGRTRAALTNDMYELDLIRRHWSKLETYGDLPPPRYFHSVCGLGDTKLVCYGGMSPAPTAQGSPQPPGGQDPQPEVVVMSDIYIYDVPTRTWTAVPTPDAPQGRYAHCATILPSSASFSSQITPLAGLQNTPLSANPNSAQLGLQLEGLGGAEMVVVGGQDSANHYIEQISVFNFRSLQWTSTSPLERSCGAYRSVVAPLNGMKAEKIGMGKRKSSEIQEDDPDDDGADGSGSAMLIYSNYNFLDVKLELQVRLPDGTLTERPMYGNFSPPGLRFPNGGVINDHFVVSGTFLTSSKQEYALWALDLRTLSWSRIEAGNSTFSQGSWNRGVLWARRNTFVILGNRKRNLVEDYNHRRLNFSNVCMVELEAFGLYDNPRRTKPTSSYVSTSAAPRHGAVMPWVGGQILMKAAEDLGQMAMGLTEIADMDFLAIGGERTPVNSRLIAKRWGPYFNQLIRESYANQDAEGSTLRPSNMGNPARFSNLTITPSHSSIRTFSSNATTMVNNANANDTDSPSGQAQIATNLINIQFDPPNPHNPNPASRPRTLFLPHTHLTIQSLVHYLYTSSLPAANSPLCTPQILCSLLQIARPYHIDGLLEAVIERLHSVLDARNCAAIFNAAAMAAGGGDGVAFITGANLSVALDRQPSPAPLTQGGLQAQQQQQGQQQQQITAAPRNADDLAGGVRGLRIDTSVARDGNESEPTSSVSSAADSDFSSQGEDMDEEEVWSGELSAVIGLQKRGLRGLMEGRRIREMGRGSGGGSVGSVGGMTSGVDRVGLGIA